MLSISDGTELYPASPAQTIWVRHYLRERAASSAFCWTRAVRIRQSIQRTLLIQSLDTVVARHEALRTTFVIEKNAVWQKVYPVLPSVLRFVDLRGLPQSRREEAAETQVASIAVRSFPLDTAPLLRTVLVRIAEDDCVFFVSAPEAICDGPSRNLLFQEIAALYQAGGSPSVARLSELPAQYRDYAIWQDAQLKTPAVSAQRHYWKSHLLSERCVCRAFHAYDDLGTRTLSQAAQINLSISGTLRDRLTALATSRGATLFMSLTASIAILLHLRTGAATVAIGSTYDQRQTQKFSHVIGMFVTNFLMNAEIENNSCFLDVLERIRDSALTAYQNMDYPLDLVAQEVFPERNLYRQRTFDVKVILQHGPADLGMFSSVYTEMFGRTLGHGRHDLTVAALQCDHGLEVTVSYAIDVFERSEAISIVCVWQQLLAQVAVAPEATIPELAECIANAPLAC